MAAVTIGTGLRKRMLGQENQRAAMRGSRNGVDRLTATMAVSTPAVSQAA